MAVKLFDKKYYTDKSLAVIRHKYYEEYTELSHTHDFVELMYVYDGKTNHNVDGTQYILTRGDLLFINYGCTHSFVSSGNMEYVNIILKPDFISHSLSGEKNIFSLLTLSDFNDFSNKIDLTKKYVHFSSDERGIIEALITVMENEYINPQGSDFVLRSALNVFLANVFRKLSISLTEQMNIDSQLLSYIKRNCSEKLTVEKVASSCSYNASYFSRRFKKFVGMTFVEYLSKCRIDKACELLLTSSKSIEEIISECGFSDRTRFYKLFNLQTGLSPLKYRKNMMI